MCEETGILSLGDHTGPAHRSYRYFVDVPDYIRIEHGDGAPFVSLKLSDGIAEARHICGDDTYDGVVSIIDDNNWTQHWIVAGPSKDYTLSSTLQRCR